MTDIPTITQEEAVEVLLPCPFCGGEASIDDVSTSLVRGSAILWGVGCDNSACPVEANVTDLSKVAAITNWNTRAALSPNMDHAVGGVREAQRMAYKTGYNEGYTDGTDDGTGNGYTDHNACEEGWQQYLEKINVEDISGDRVGGCEFGNSNPNRMVDFKYPSKASLGLGCTTPPVNQDAVREAEAWDWLFLKADAGQYAPNDRDYSAGEMVNAFIAGAVVALATPPLDNTGLDAATVERCAGECDMEEARATACIGQLAGASMAAETARTLGKTLRALASGDRS